MSEEVKVGSAYVEVRVKDDQLKSDFEKSKQNSQKAVKDMNSVLSKIRTSVDNSTMKLNIKQAEELATKLRAKLEQKIKLGADIGSIERTRTALASVESRLQGIQNKGETAVDMLKGKFKELVGTVLALEGIKKTVEGAFEMSKASAELEEMRSYFKGSEHDLQLLRQAVKDTVDDGGLITLSNYASDLGISLKNQPIFFALAKKSAESYGVDVEAGMQKVIQATEGNIKGVSKLGIERNKYKEIVNALAKAHGGLITELDAETQKEVRIQALLKASNMTMEEATEGAKSHADQIQETGKKWKNLSNIIGSGLSPFFSGIFSGLSKAIDYVKELASRMQGVLKIGGGDERKDQYFQGIKGMTTAQLNEEKDVNSFNVDDTQRKMKENADAQKKLYGWNGVKTLTWTKEDRQRYEGLQSEYRILEAQLNTYKEQQAVLVDIDNYKKRDNTKENNSGGLSEDTIQKRKDQLNEYQQKRLASEKTLNDAIAKSQSLRITDEFDRENDFINKKLESDLEALDQQQKLELQKSGLTAEMKNEINKSYEADRERIMMEASNSIDDNEEKRIKKHEADSKEETQKLLEFTNMRKALERGVNDFFIQQHKMSVEDYKRYLDEQLDADIEALAEKNKLIEEDNKKHNRNTPLVNLKKYRDQRQTENNGQVETYDVEKWQKDNKILAELSLSTIDSITNSWSSAFSEMLSQGTTFAEATAKIWQNMGVQILSVIATITTKWLLLQAVTAIFGTGATGFGGFLINALGGGKAIVSGTNPKGISQQSSGLSTAMMSSFLPLTVNTGAGALVQPSSQMRSDAFYGSDVTRNELRAVKDSINSLAIITMQKNTNVNISANLDVLKFVKEYVVPAINQLQRGNIKHD